MARIFKAYIFSVRDVELRTNASFLAAKVFTEKFWYFRLHVRSTIYMDFLIHWLVDLMGQSLICT